MQMNKKAYELAQEWVRWLDTRRFFGPPMQRHILAQFMPSKTSREPNGIMSPEINAFNMAVASLDIGHFVPFIVVYCYDSKHAEHKLPPVKCIADGLDISRRTFYDRAHTAADRCLKHVRMLGRISRTATRD